MIKPNKVLLLIALFVFIVLSSCIKDKKKPIYLNKDLKNYFNYQKGSYWIFYDSLNGKVDSLYVESNINYSPFSYAGSNDPNEQQIINIVGDSIRWKLTLTSNSISNIRIVYSNTLTKNVPFFIGRTNFDDGFYECSLIPTLTSNSMTYTNVYKINYVVQNGINGRGDENNFYFINRDNGFIRIFINTKLLSKKMHLVKSNIIH